MRSAKQRKKNIPFDLSDWPLLPDWDYDLLSDWDYSIPDIEILPDIETLPDIDCKLYIERKNDNI